MVTADYRIAYSEVLEILKHISKEEFNKIPSNMIEMFKENSNSDSSFVYNPEKTLQEQNVSETTRTIIAILFRDYWATEEQKEKIISVQNAERERIKREKYNPDNVFKKPEQAQIVENENVAMVEYKEPLLKRILNRIKSLFNF